ncbi:MAG: phosphatase PAP2 family protein [Candidatus Diapherotrites archaeon]|nr:phosphatase PAP2 family protein [Candidatus Diapherotrites archaeon]
MNVLFPAAIQAFDEWFLHALQATFSSGLLDIAMKGITLLGHPVVWIMVAALVYWKGKENHAFFLMNAVMFAALAAGIIKIFVARPRPDQGVFRVVAQDTYNTASFPSGHATTIASVFAYTRGFLDRQKKLLLAFAVIAVAVSRMYLGVHFLTDVLGGIILGLCIGTINAWSRKQWLKHGFRLTKPEEELGLVAAVVLAVIAIIVLGDSETVSLGTTFLGFYAGFFAWKELGKTQSAKAFVPKSVIGLIVLGALLGAGQFVITDYYLKAAAFFIAGLWISLIQPVLAEKLA